MRDQQYPATFRVKIIPNGFRKTAGSFTSPTPWSTTNCGKCKSQSQASKRGRQHKEKLQIEHEIRQLQILGLNL